MASTSTSTCSPNPETEEIVVAVPSPSTSTTPSLRSLFSSCFNFCSFILSLCSTSTSTRTHPNAFQLQEEQRVPSPSDTHAFEQLVPSTSISVTLNRKLPYDVFINHRGPDVKHTLAATIYKILTDSMGLRVFLDNQELDFGDFLPTEIEEAMRSASLHIAIFSQNYADSPWCLAELSFMLKTGTKIVPVFYHVQPNDVRYAKGVYGKAFLRHLKKGRYSEERLQEWKNALNSVSFNVGGIIHNDNDEGPLMKNIVGSVLKEIKNVPFVVANHPIGLDEAAQDFERTTLENRTNVEIVGIWGMGGSGKTTLAKYLYNNKYKLMDKSSFLLDVRDASSKSKLHKKQKKLLQDLGLPGVSIDNVEEGQGILANRLRFIRVLIVLDDVDSVDQLNALVPKKDSLEFGSLILVTSRELDVLRCWGILSSSIYKMKPLNSFHAKQLFCWHAFLRPSPYQGFEDLAQKFLDICDGLPLSLKVLGAQLYGISDKGYWEIQLQKISRILPKNIKERLKVSYDALDNEEKQIFLDIACFFIGEKRSSAIAAWDGLGWNGQHSWEQLFNKCLVELDDSFNQYHHDRIRMHDHLRDLGREIANDQSPYRLWSPQQIIDVGNEARGIAIRGIMETAAASTSFLGCSQDGKLIFKASSVNCSLEPSSLGLKFFHVRGNYYNKIIGDLSRELVWLCWHDIEQRSLQTFTSLKNLRVLELKQKYGGEHQLEKLWDTEINAPVQLRELFITFCEKFQGFPKSIGCLQHLKKIIINYGDVMRRLPEEFCLLQSLEHLELSGSELSSLPCNFGDLRNMRHLAFSECKKLRRLPLSFKKLTLLQYLHLGQCYELKLESDILENMTRLEHLIISGSKQLEELPRHITNQASLTELCCKIERLKEIPVNIGQLRKLRSLVISSRLVTNLPTSLGDLSSLTSLFISGCPKLECLPESIGDLSSLTSLHISRCPKLECLPESLRRLHLLECLWIQGVGVKSLQKQLMNIQRVDIRQCPISELHPEAGLFRRLKSIYIYSTDVAKVSISTDLPQLKGLYIDDNRHLEEIECIPNTLQTLRLIRCPKLEVLPSFAQLASLEYLWILGCGRVKKIAGFEHCGATSERLGEVILQTMSGSGFEGFIQRMKTCPRQGIRVCTRAVGDAATIVNSFAFPNLSLIHSFANQKAKAFLSFERPSSTGRCILLCFVVNCTSPKTTLDLGLGGNHTYQMELEERGKWVWTVLLTKHTLLNSFKSDIVHGYVCLRTDAGIFEGDQVERGVVVVGEEESAWQAFSHLCVALAN